MANKVIKYDSFKRGDTPVFTFLFSQPYVGFVWTSITADIVMTAVESPADNSGAGVVRLNVTPTIDPITNSATYTMQPTVLESKALLPDTDYKVEIQIHDGVNNVTTPVTGTVKVLQDYAI